MFHCKEEMDMKSMLTLVCERFYSDRRSRSKVLNWQFSFGSNLKEVQAPEEHDTGSSV